MSTEPASNIAIAGGGLLGRLLAWHLSEQGRQVTLFEFGSLASPTGACWTAAGMISPLSELVHSPIEVYRMGLESLKLWPQWIQSLEQLVGETVHYRTSGSVVVAHQRDNAQLSQFQFDLQRTLGEKFAGEVSSLSAENLHELEPDLAHFSNGIFLRNEADINNRRLLSVLLRRLRQLPVNLQENTPVDCEPHTVILRKSGERKNFDLVIDCRGMGAKPLLKDLRGVRGEVMVVESNEVHFQRPVRMMHPRYKLYAVSKPNGTTVIGATEIESEDLSPISIRSTLELASALYTLHPALAEARVVETNVNLRPAVPDNLPFVRVNEGLIQANGLYRHGYLCGPALVSRVLDAVAENARSGGMEPVPVEVAKGILE